MNKLSITLPDGGQVCIETDDRELVREVLYSFMPHLADASGETPAAVSGVGADAGGYSNGHGRGNGVARHVPAEPVASVPAGPAPQPAPVVVQQIAPAPVASSPAAVEHPAAPTSDAPAPAARTTASEHEFIAFCQRMNPLGDMRKVVVAAEAAHRCLGVNSVDPDELSRLFSLAGWPIPHSFVQTLRNAARTKFRWLERIPGQPGHYKVTSTGRSIVLGEAEVASEAG